MATSVLGVHRAPSARVIGHKTSSFGPQRRYRVNSGGALRRQPPGKKVIQVRRRIAPFASFASHETYH